MSAAYDVFVSHAWADGDRSQSAGLGCPEPCMCKVLCKEIGSRSCFILADDNGFGRWGGSHLPRVDKCPPVGRVLSGNLSS
jgi:hypothetical protein